MGSVAHKLAWNPSPSSIVVSEDGRRLPSGWGTVDDTDPIVRALADNGLITFPDVPDEDIHPDAKAAIKAADEANKAGTSETETESNTPPSIRSTEPLADETPGEPVIASAAKPEPLPVNPRRAIHKPAHDEGKA